MGPVGICGYMGGRGGRRLKVLTEMVAAAGPMERRAKSAWVSDAS
jgi:hypothetical protein